MVSTILMAHKHYRTTSALTLMIWRQALLSTAQIRTVVSGELVMPISYEWREQGEGVKAPKLLINLSTIKASETAILLHVHVHVDYNGFYPHRSRMVDHIGDLLGVAPQRGNDLLRVLLEDHGILVCSTCMYVGEGRGGEGRGEERREREYMY